MSPHTQSPHLISTLASSLPPHHITPIYDDPADTTSSSKRPLEIQQLRKEARRRADESSSPQFRSPSSSSIVVTDVRETVGNTVHHNPTTAHHVHHKSQDTWHRPPQWNCRSNIHRKATKGRRHQKEWLGRLGGRGCRRRGIWTQSHSPPHRRSLNASIPVPAVDENHEFGVYSAQRTVLRSRRLLEMPLSRRTTLLHNQNPWTHDPRLPVQFHNPLQNAARPPAVLPIASSHAESSSVIPRKPTNWAQDREAPATTPRSTGWSICILVHIAHHAACCDGRRCWGCAERSAHEPMKCVDLAVDWGESVRHYSGGRLRARKRGYIHDSLSLCSAGTGLSVMDLHFGDDDVEV
ncbi:hypothetical protein FPV67DRAFT_1449079 [Lyophyllum atratum]|nr:hypothetical protein FPV67DRAFT_1449079 [Lyophyllum atratum]